MEKDNSWMAKKPFPPRTLPRAPCGTRGGGKATVQTTINKNRYEKFRRREGKLRKGEKP